MRKNGAGAGFAGVWVAAVVFAVMVSGCGGGGGSGTGVSPVTDAGVPVPVPPPATCTSGGAGPIAISVVASRTSGVAPLAVFFDATATTAAGTSAPFHDVEYRWSFGDAGSGFWTQGTRPGVNSRNEATGPVAAHVFETPGTYTVTLTVTNGTTTAIENCVQIIVDDPEVVFNGTTTCVAVGAIPVAGGPGGCPAGAAVVQSSDFDGTIAAQLALGKRRILFNRGETFFVNTAAARINVTGPGIIGAYGTGARPVVQSTGPVSRINVSSNVTPTVADWRIMDLQLDGQGSTGSGVNGSGSASQFTFLRLNIFNIKFGFSFAVTTLDAINTPTFTSPLWDQMAIVDSTISQVVGGAGAGGNAVFMGARRLSFMGNFIDDTTNAEHGLRTPVLIKGVVSNNTIQNIAAGRANITIRSPDFVGGSATIPPGTYTEQIVVSDNQLIGGASDGIGGTGATTTLEDGRPRLQIWERNWIRAGAGTQQAISFEGADITFRNNVIDMSTSASAGGARALIVLTANAALDSQDIRIYNNTFFRSDAGVSTFRAITVQANAINILVRNNLVYGPLTVGATTINDQGAISLNANNNTADGQITVNPLFTVASPSAFTDYGVGPGSYAFGGGIAVPVWSDLYRVNRPVGTIDIGATEQ